MGAHRRRIAVGAVVVALALAVSLIVGIASSTTGPTPPKPALGEPSSAGPSSAHPSSAGPASTLPPSATDVAAARACEAFAVYLEHARTGTIPKEVGAELVTTAAALLQGARQDAAAGRPLPKWAELGSKLLAAAADVVNHDAGALQADGADADRRCAAIPATAASAGGYLRSG